MRSLEESFLESDFESRAIARQHRDDRLVELQSQGYECRTENLYTIHTGMRVFIVVALPPTEAADLPTLTDPHKPKPLPPYPVERPRPKTSPQARRLKSGKKNDDLRQPRSRDRTNP